MSLLRSLHRYVSLSLALVWLILAVTGTLNVFRWEIDDASIPGPSAPADLTAVGARIDAVNEANGGSVSSIWTSGGKEGRFDIYYQADGAGEVMRIDGRGNVLRIRGEDDGLSRGGFFSKLTDIHTTLLAGNAGTWLIGISGLALLVNIILGLKLAWPRRGQWRKALFASPQGRSAARLYGWHRKLGLWLGIPALFTITAGLMMVFLDAVESGLGASLPEPQVEATAAPEAASASATGAALLTALERFPGSSISGFYMPSDESPWYRIRLRVPGEVPRKWGTTNLWVAQDGNHVLAAYDASEPAAGRAVVDTLYPLHTGQIGGWAGRLLVFAIGCWLSAMIVLGLALWWLRRREVRRAKG